MKLYSLEEAEYLKDYFSPKIINKIVDVETALRITSIEIIKHEKDLYHLSCSGYFVNSSSINPTISLQSIVKSMDLDSLEIVLQHRNQ